MADEWIFFEPNQNDGVYEINTFDDGNEKYRDYVNQWVLFGSWRGKYAVINQTNTDIKINSISQWKLGKLFRKNKE